MKIQGDYLKRENTVDDIMDIINGCFKSETSTTFSIEGEWGRGKTWIIDKLINLLEEKEINQEEIETEEENATNSRCLVFKYNAWEKDYYNEPIIAIIVTMINQLNEKLLRERMMKGELVALFEFSKEILEEALRSVSVKVFGLDIVDTGKKMIESVRTGYEETKIKPEIKYFESSIEKDIDKIVWILNYLSKKTPIVFIVDELDRCLPEYAIKTLERLHHIFERVHISVTIISVNEVQLRETVRKMFGEKISFEAYLKKFIDFRIALDSGVADKEQIKEKLQSFFNLFGRAQEEEKSDTIIVDLCDLMNAREFEKVCKNALLCHMFVGKDTLQFPKECAIAELMLFACKIAIEKEGSRANIIPIYGNEPKTKIGKYLKNAFRALPIHTPNKVTSALEKIAYICLKGILTKEEQKKYYFNELYYDMQEVDVFYDKYCSFYKLIK